MIPRSIGLVSITVFLTVAGCKNQSQQSVMPTSRSSAQAASPVSSQPKIITKNPEFWKLLHPPQGEALLGLSADYQQKKNAIDTKVASLQDSDLKKRMFDEEWARVDKSLYISNEEQALRDAFPQEMQKFLQQHSQDWFELGHVEFSGTDSLEIKSIEASLVDFPAGSTIRLDIHTIDGIYSKFRAIAGDRIQQMVSDWAEEQSCTAKLRNVCRNLGGTPSECSSPATLAEIQERLGAGLSLECTDHPSPEEGRKIAEKQLRADRIILMGQGDPARHRIDECMLVDYDTEKTLLTIDPKVLNAIQPRWRYETPQVAPATLKPEPKDTPFASGSEGAPNSDAERSVREALDNWVQSFRNKDARTQAKCYAPVVETYFRWHNVSREQLVRDKEKAFAAMGEIRKYEIRDVQVSLEPATQSSDSSPTYSRADATFQKEWDTSTVAGKIFAGREIEKLTFASSAEGWKIVGEEELKILQVVRQ